MKKNELKEIKSLEPKEIFLRVAKIKEEIIGIRMDRFNSTKAKQGSTNLKDMYEKRKDVAQLLTIARQKEILGSLQSESVNQLTSELETKEEKPKKRVRKEKTS